MSDEKGTKLSQDALKQVAGCTPAAKELSLEELKQVTGGLKIDGIDGESQDDKPKNEIHVDSF
jgi:bacteriocin-like protein